jgi:aspartyl-tRNA(Asn)/glutamyl-tRNA(Gln) amidotransferase subunit C
MKIDDDSIDRLSELAKLRPDDKEREGLKSDLNKVLDFVEKLEELDCEGVPPLKHVLDEGGGARPDEIRDEVDQKDALRNAPDKDSDYIKVPKFVRRQEEG